MEHLKKFLHSVKLPVRETLSLDCVISEKIDGNAFQVYNDNDTIVYGKRGSSPKTRSTNTLTEFDLLINTLYYNAYTYLSQYEYIFRNYSIINFELFERNSNHIISYGGQYKHDIVLLSVYDKNGNLVNGQEFCNIAELIDVSVSLPIWSGNISSDVIDTIMTNKDDDDKIWTILTDKYCHELLKNTKNIEGIVLSFKNGANLVRILKVQNPVFQHKIMEHLSNERDNKENMNLEDVYSMFITEIGLNKNDGLITNVLNMYMGCEFSEKDFTDVEKKLEKVEVLKKQKINTIIAEKYCELFNENVEYPALLNFIVLGFINILKKNPLWCSLDFQLTKLNPFIESISK